MSLGRTRTALALAALYTAGVAATAQYSTPVGSGAARPKTLRATAVLEWTGTLEKPNASRLMPIAVWDGEHYQPAGLYLARPAPLAFETGTQYQLERSGEPVGLFNVRGAAELQGEWIGMGKFQAEAPPPPPPKLKPSKHLPVASGTKSESSAGSGKDAAGSDRPTLHRKTDDSQSGSAASTSTSSNAPASGSNSPASSTSSNSKSAPAASTPSAQPADPSGSKTDDADRPTLHRRADSSDTSSTPAAGSPASGGQSTTTGTTAPAPGTSPGTSSTSTDPDRPTLHRHDDTTASGSAPDSDRPTLHKHSDTSSDAGKTDDPDRPTLHRSHSTSDTTASIDPDRPRLRYGQSDDSGGSALPTRLEGAPPTMQQLVAVSDAGPIDPRPYQYHWPDPGDAAKMQSALASLATLAVARPHPASDRPAAQFGPAARAAARKAKAAGSSKTPAAPALVDEHFAAYELSFSGGATLVYSAHTADDGPQRVYVTLIAQPDFSGKPQVLLQQVARADRLDETPALQLVDAVDTDNDQKAELIFQLNGATTVQALADRSAGSAAGAAAPDSTATAPQPGGGAQPAATVEVKERAFAIYRVANGKAVEVFNTGPLP